jgi:hypothetical protein
MKELHGGGGTASNRGPKTQAAPPAFDAAFSTGWQGISRRRSRRAGTIVD